MYKIEETPFFLWLLFMTLYFAVGDSANFIWSGLFFCMNYILIIWAFTVRISKKIKTIGVSLSFSLLFFSIIKFFLYPEIERFCIFILFIISILIHLHLQKRK